MGLGDNIASGFADVAGDFVDVGKGIAHAVGDVIELEGDVGAAVIGGIAHTQQSVASTVLHGTEALIDTARSNVHHAAEAVADVTGDRDTKIRRTMSKNDPHGGRGRGHGNDSGVPIVVDPTIKQPIVDYYQEQSDAVARILDHVATYCNVDGSFGLLLGIFLKPNYIASRARTVEACEALKDAIEAVSDQFQGAMADMEQNEDSITSLLEKILRELEEARQNGGGSSTGGTSDTGTTSTTGGGGGYGGGGYGGGGYGGGGYGGGGGYPIPSYPEPTITDPSATDPAHVNVSVHVDADGNVDVDVDVDGSAADVDVDVDVDGNGDHSSIDDADTVDAATTSDAAAPTGAGGTGGGAGGGAGGTAEDPQELGMDPIDGKLPEIKTGDEQLTAEQLAERATYYDRIWTELAADDPLGRTPDELRLAWETREELKLDPSVVTGTTTLGYGETATFAKPTVDFGLIATPEGAAA